MKKQQWCYLAYSQKSKGVHNIPKGISFESEFEVAYLETVHFLPNCQN